MIDDEDDEKEKPDYELRKMPGLAGVEELLRQAQAERGKGWMWSPQWDEAKRRLNELCIRHMGLSLEAGAVLGKGYGGHPCRGGWDVSDGRGGELLCLEIEEFFQTLMAVSYSEFGRWPDDELSDEDVADNAEAWATKLLRGGQS